QTRPDHIHRGKQSGQSHRAGSLYVVVESAQSISIPFEQPSCVVLREVLPLQQHVWKLVHYGLNKRLDEVVVLLASDTMPSQSEIKGIAQKLFVIGAQIEDDGQRPGRR